MNAARNAAVTTAASLLMVLGLAACTGGAGSPPPSVSESLASAEPSLAESAMPSAPPPAPSESAAPSASQEPAANDAFAWADAGTFSGPGATSVTDVAAWDGGFLAVGHAWADGFIHGPGEPLVWVSEDGRSWSEVDPGLGTTDVELRGILPLTTGGVVIVGDVGAQAAQSGEGPITSAAWRSTDGQTWNEFELPSEIASQAVSVASGPVGHVIVTGSEVWYSADAESWQLAYEVDEGVDLGQPRAGDEGFAMPATHREGEQALVLASGDGIAWFEAEPPVHLLGVAPLGGDWLAWAYTEGPTIISTLRSANGLDWSVALDVNDLTPPDGPKAGLGMESGITEATVSGEGGVVVMTLGWNHCCAQLPVAVGVWTTTDGATWQQADLPADAHVSAFATDGEVVVAAGNLDRGGEAAFWVADR
jgi:hypothetical protein